MKKVYSLENKKYKKIFIACSISKYIDGNKFTDSNYRKFTEKLYDVCATYSDDVFMALRREEYGKKLMKEMCTELDFCEMKTTDLVVAFPDDSKGVAVELGWASVFKKRIILVLDRNKRYTPLVSGLGDMTQVVIVWYENNLDNMLLESIDVELRTMNLEDK